MGESAVVASEDKRGYWCNAAQPVEPLLRSQVDPLSRPVIETTFRSSNLRTKTTTSSGPGNPVRTRQTSTIGILFPLPAS